MGTAAAAAFCLWTAAPIVSAEIAPLGPDAPTSAKTSSGDGAEDEFEEDERPLFLYGFTMGFGFTTTFGSYWRDENLQIQWGEDARKSVAFAFSISMDFEYWFHEQWAIFVGAGIARKGTVIKDWVTEQEVEWEGLTESILYAELPVGVKVRLSGWQLGLGIATYIGIRGSTTVDDGDTTDRTSWAAGKWDEYRRVNFGPKFLVGYAFILDRISTMPSLEWNMHLLSDVQKVKQGLSSSFDQSRYMTILFKLGVSFF